MFTSDDSRKSHTSTPCTHRPLRWTLTLLRFFGRLVVALFARILILSTTLQLVAFVVLGASCYCCRSGPQFSGWKVMRADAAALNELHNCRCFLCRLYELLSISDEARVFHVHANIFSFLLFMYGLCLHCFVSREPACTCVRLGENTCMIGSTVQVL